MKQYKLIKEYPLSPKLGTIIDDSRDKCYFWDKNGFYLNVGEIQKYPEIWEEVKEKDYEIISYIENNTNRVFSKEFVKPMKKKYPQYASIKMIYACMDGGWIENEEYIVNNLKIHSVKRLSDGEVFTIGDILQNNCKIESIIYNISKNRFPSDISIWYNNNCVGTSLELVSKLKKLLFITEDGVDIFEGNEWYCVDVEDFDFGVYLGGINSRHKPLNLNDLNIRRFSSKEKAEEYIIKNKPCLSYNEIVSFTGNSFKTFHEFHSKLKDFTKSKLNIK